MPKHLLFISILFILISLPVQAATISDNEEENIAALNCVELDDSISSLIPSTYSTKPGFYDDPDNISIASIGLYTYTNALYFWVYKEGERRGEQAKIMGHRKHVAELRLAKARKRCFE